MPINLIIIMDIIMLIVVVMILYNIVILLEGYVGYQPIIVFDGLEIYVFRSSKRYLFIELLINLRLLD